jgi:Threonine aldolase
VVFFSKEHAQEFDYRAKQGGQLASKMRFLAAPWVGLLNGQHLDRQRPSLNKCAQLLAKKLTVALGIEPAFSCEANAVFLPMSAQLVARLQERGWHFYKFMEPDIYRFMCSWATSEKDIDDFVNDVRNSLVTMADGA